MMNTSPSTSFQIAPAGIFDVQEEPRIEKSELHQVWVSQLIHKKERWKEELKKRNSLSASLGQKFLGF